MVSGRSLTDIAAQNGLRKCEPMSRYYNDELYHSGVKHRSGRFPWGSGKRPFQGEGGVKEGFKKIKPYFEPDLKEGKGKENKSAAEKAAQQTSKVFDSVSNMNRSLSNYFASGNDIKLYSQAKKMSDSELRTIINRRNLERQYVQAMQDPVTQRGYDRTNLVLQTLSTGAAIAGAGATIYSAGRTIYNKVHNK